MQTDLVILMLIVLASLANVVYQQTKPTSAPPLKPKSFVEADDTDAAALAAMLDGKLLRLGSKSPGYKRTLQSILDQAPRDKPWNEVGDYIVAESQRRFLNEDAPDPHAEVTLVSGVFDLGYDGAGLEMSDVNSLLDNFLKYPQKKVLFLEESIVDMVAPSLGDDTKVVLLSSETIRSYFGKSYDDVLRIQSNPNWKYSVGWLQTAPQAALPAFNMIGMAKMFLLREASRLNPWDHESFMWFDPGLSCVKPHQLARRNMDIFNAQFDRFLLPFFEYNADVETHGFPKHTLDYFLGQNRGGPHKVVKGWAFGGRPAHIEVVALLFDLVMRETLRQGQMGNADCILSIVLARFGDVIHPWDLTRACKDSTNYDHSCPGFNHPAYWCSIFDWAIKGPP